ncbi:unnamed protein product [Didymodactylos carnosus]|uniref:Ion transport domain-containing protein n=1 Tax=Didymodactylos carnosus TaxID=1234261 RepID=A0A815GES6_9BILA|nr:unnamed protein product [Didymodactylos carnosus]CAF1337608.1 unnamed protein product [Didymodactylos carnosus]CAF3882167.1 unnamed protein product [Didymodactylos carnosus]CAF4196192.1 unnamed protein product [Didymodactylos carnosus]
MGLYVVMLQVIFIKFLKLIPVLMILICGFGLSYYMLLQYQPVYGTPFEALMRTSLMLFELGYEDRLYSSDKNGVMYYPVIYFIFILTAIVMTILITNLLIGLAVGEIPTLKTQAKLHRDIMLYELLSDYEILHLQIKRLYRFLIKYCLCQCCCLFSLECYKRCCPHCTVSYQDYDKQYLPIYYPTFWMCKVHSRSAIEVNQDPQQAWFGKRWWTWLETRFTENDIQESIVYEKQYKGMHKQNQDGFDE